jgi:actin-like ATPase involved in cell morphogenesis
VIVADDPLMSVAKGAGMVLEDAALKKILTNHNESSSSMSAASRW